jgi:hypothetical protein
MVEMTVSKGRSYGQSPSPIPLFNVDGRLIRAESAQHCHGEELNTRTIETQPPTELQEIGGTEFLWVPG